MAKASSKPRHIIISLLLFLGVLAWALSQLEQRPVNGQGFFGSDWLNLQTWTTPLANHSAMGQTVVNLHDLNKVYFVDNQHGWAVGDGNILFTDNGGKNWQQQTSPVKTPLYSVYFADTQHGWAVGLYGVILSTENGGKNWQQQISPVKTLINCVYFADTQHGWAVGFAGVIVSTDNGGKTWQQQTTPVETSLYSVNSVYFADAQHGWVVGANGVILSTDNGGKTWQQQISPVDTWLDSVYFSDAQHGWAVGSGVVLSTDNGGKIWQQQFSPVKTQLYSVYFADTQHGWAVGFAGVIVSTDNGGKTWQQQTTPVNTSLYSIYFADAQHGWVVGANGVILSTDNGGKIWNTQVRAVDSTFTSVHFVDVQHGWTVTMDIILSTDNGGKIWQQQTSPVKTLLNSVYFADAQRGWAVGSNGVILSTDNGGKTWQQQTTPFKTPLYSVYFADTQHGWAVGFDGVTLSTVNGGKTWQQQTSTVKTSLQSVYFADTQHGWAVGSGVVLSTGNGGKIWQQQTTPVKIFLVSVYFADTQHGWVIGPDGILSTDNGGKTWQQQTTPVKTSLYSVNFADAQHGWAVGPNGAIVSTDNGGKIWQQQTTPVKNSLYSVHFIDAQNGWVAGAFGTILSTSNGGVTWQNVSPDPTVFAEGQPELTVLPSPLALLSLVIFATVLTYHIYRYYAEPRSLQGGISDAPIESNAEDCLDRRELVRTLADLIRNRDTVPPLAIAINAPWGSGKSSMLGLLREELQGEVFTVQLNAWHYRDDGQLLAALMEHIRKQALPPLLSLDNLWFRLRLLCLRWFSDAGRRLWLLLLGGLVATVYFGREQNWQIFSDWLDAQQPTGPLKQWLQVNLGQPWLTWLTQALAATAILLLLKSKYNAFYAFSPELVKLATRFGKSAGEAMKVTDWSKDAGLRFRFAEDFAAVAKALGKGRLLLLIDDLDRCEPSQIEAVMSTLNFLFSTSAPCYSVLAMDWEYVTDALGLAFENMAIARDENDLHGKKFAGYYVEKIIQISINLPVAASHAVALRDHSRAGIKQVADWRAKFAQHPALTRLKPANRWARAGLNAALDFTAILWREVEAALWGSWQTLKNLNSKLLKPVYDYLLIIILALLLGMAAVQLGLFMQTSVTKAIPVIDTPAPQVPTDPGKKPPEPENNLADKPEASNFEAPVVIVDEPLYPTEYWLAAFTAALAAALLMMVWRLRRQVQDTRIFIEVMQQWRDWLSQHHNNPARLETFIE
jgi:photosystem II stability/assembly factor-like uncharacterized protein